MCLVREDGDSGEGLPTSLEIFFFFFSMHGVSWASGEHVEAREETMNSRAAVTK